MRKVSEYWPELATSLLFLVVVYFMTMMATGHNDGKFIYDMDDAYIHMALAKNMVLYHTWGVYGSEFTSLSSSLLWTVVIYLSYLAFGINEISPFILNLLFALGTIFLGGFILGKFRISRPVKFIILVAMVFLAPLPAISFSGLEHNAHIMLTIAYIFVAAKALGYSSSGLTDTWDDYRRYRYFLFGLAPFLVAARYEGMFLLGMVSFLFLVRRKYITAIINSVLGLIPISVFGIYAISKGWFFLPNSILIKSNTPNYKSLLGLAKYPASFIVHLISYPHLLIFLALVLTILYLRLREKDNLWGEFNILLVLFASIILLHAQFGCSGWVYRYEGYLMAAGVMIVGIIMAVDGFKLPDSNSFHHRFFRQAILAIIIFIIASPALKRGYNSLTDAPTATFEVYGQQYQMGLFLDKYYRDEPVAINDVGSVNFLSHIKCLDLLGLGNREIGRARIMLRYDVNVIERLSRQNDISLAIVNDKLYDLANIGGLPKSWIAVGQWHIPSNLINASDHVTFYAIDNTKARRLIHNLRDFSPRLPSFVRQTGLYMEASGGELRPSVSN